MKCWKEIRGKAIDTPKTRFARFASGDSHRLSRALPDGQALQLIAAACVMFLLAACTIVPINQAGISPSGSGGNFNAANYVDSIWSSKVVPTVTSKAVDLSTLIPALQQDAKAASQKYGNQVNGEYSFMVKGQGKVTKVETGSVNGMATVELGNGLPPVTVQVGPLILGTSLRDAVGFITFNDFTNQIDYGSVSTALNKKAAQEALGSNKPESLQGKTISFLGTFTYSDINQIVIAPVKIDVTG